MKSDIQIISEFSAFSFDTENKFGTFAVTQKKATLKMYVHKM